MSEVKVVLPGGSIVIASSQKSADELSKAIVTRQQIVANYCKSKGWPTDPTQLSFEQILEIRDTKEWIDAGK